MAIVEVHSIPVMRINLIDVWDFFFDPSTVLGIIHVKSLLRFVVLLTFVAAWSEATAQPGVNVVLPPAVQRGAECELHFHGGSLSQPHSILFYRPGIEVLELKEIDAGHVVARCKVAADCQLSLMGMRLCTAQGISNLRLVTVTNLPVVPEIEPNSDRTQPQAISFGSTITGVLENEDIDHYAFEVNEGSRVSIEVEALRLGYDFIDPRIEVYDQAGTRIAAADDVPLTRQDPCLTFLAKTAGKYTLLVQDATLRGSGRFLYALHLGGFPRPLVAIPGGGHPGETVAMQAIFPDSQVSTLPVQLPPDTRGIWTWYPEDAQGIAPSPLNVFVSDLTNTIEVEPNDDHKQATSCVLPGAMSGICDAAGGADYYRFSAKAGEVWVIRTVCRTLLRSRIDPVITLFHAEGNYITASDDTATADGLIEFTVPQDGDYVVSIRDHLSQQATDFFYRIEIVRRQPELTLLMPDRYYNTTTTVAVPQGNRMAVLVVVSRVNFGGPVQLALQDLPAGVAAQTPLIGEDRDRIPVLLTASPEAPLAGKLASFLGSAKVGEGDVQGSFQQHTMLVIGENNRDMWGHDATRPAISVSQKAPFEVQIIPAKVPLVRDGSLDLKISATKASGFDEPIQIQMLYNPPGVSSPGSVTLPAGQTEVPIQLTANGGAGIGTWPIAVTAIAVKDGIRHEVSSQLFDLQIDERFVTAEFEKSAIEQGQTGTMTMHWNRRVASIGKVTAELVGLPPGVTTSIVEVPADVNDVVLPVVAGLDAKLGRHTNVMCRIIHMHPDEPVTAYIGGGQLRVDPPSGTATAPGETSGDAT